MCHLLPVYLGGLSGHLGQLARWEGLGRAQALLTDPLDHAVCPAVDGPAGVLDRIDCVHDLGHLHLGYRLANEPPMLLDVRPDVLRSEDHTSELQSLMSISYAVCCLQKNTKYNRYYR